MLGYLPFGLPVCFFESARPVRAPGCSRGVDLRIIRWRSVLFYSWPVLHLLFRCLLRLFNRHLMLGDSRRLLLGDFVASPWLLLHACSA